MTSEVERAECTRGTGPCFASTEKLTGLPILSLSLRRRNILMHHRRWSLTVVPNSSLKPTPKSLRGSA